MTESIALQERFQVRVKESWRGGKCHGHSLGGCWHRRRNRVRAFQSILLVVEIPASSSFPVCTTGIRGRLPTSHQGETQRNVRYEIVGRISNCQWVVSELASINTSTYSVQMDTLVQVRPGMVNTRRLGSWNHNNYVRKVTLSGVILRTKVQHHYPVRSIG